MVHQAQQVLHKPQVQAELAELQVHLEQQDNQETHKQVALQVHQVQTVLPVQQVLQEIAGLQEQAEQAVQTVQMVLLVTLE